MYSDVKFYKKDKEVHEIYFLVRLRGLKEANVPGENSNDFNFNENKNITIRQKVNSVCKILPSYNI